MTDRQALLRRARSAAVALVVLLACWPPLSVQAGASQTGKQASQPTSVEGSPFPTAEDAPLIPQGAIKEVKDALLRLPLAAVLGTAMALRPRRRSLARRSVAVVQTQIMLAVVGAVIMLVVGNSLSRAFGIVGAAGLVKYRSTIDDPKEAVVMLCSLGAGLAAGVGLYILAPFATLFMASVLWIVEYFEPSARKAFELTVSTKEARHFRPQLEGVLSALHLEYELLSESDESVGYSISAPVDVRTRDISDTLRLLSRDEEISIEWEEKKPRK